MTEPSYAELKERLERAEGILRTLEHGEADAFISRDGPGLVRSMDVIGRESQVKLALEELAKARAIDLLIAEKSREAAEATNNLKSVFISHMSHELRTPLNAILGFAHLLETSVPPLLDVQVKRLGEIKNAGWHLVDLINEILDLSLIESGKLSLSLEPLLLKQVMLECRAFIELQAKQRDIKLTFPQFDIPCFVHADRIRLKQVLINLLSNAVKYNREHGAIEVTCAITTSGSLRISVKDKGMGLPPEKLGQLFQPFNRLGQENGAVEGTGIGLMVTKQLVELMGGTIGVESTVGDGSKFWIELPPQADMPQLAS
jgi:signal transduction histidine kinase